MVSVVEVGVIAYIDLARQRQLHACQPTEKLCPEPYEPSKDPKSCNELGVRGAFVVF